DARGRLARDLRAARPAVDLLEHLAGADHRRRRDGHVDGADDRYGNARRRGRQGGCRLSRPEQRAAGRRLARDRGDGRDRRVVRARAADRSTGARAVRRRVPARIACCGVHRVLRCDRGRRAAAQTGACRRVEPGSGARRVSSRLSGPERRQAVVETACRVFAKSSYRGSTTAQIARETGVTEPVLYRHFASKRELYLACLDAVWERVQLLWDKALEGETDPTNWLRSIGKAYLEERGAGRIVLVDLWIQALTEAADDPEIRRALRAQLREV